jgi:hypothetical protein
MRGKNEAIHGRYSLLNQVMNQVVGGCVESPKQRLVRAASVVMLMKGLNKISRA